MSITEAYCDGSQADIAPSGRDAHDEARRLAALERYVSHDAPPNIRDLVRTVGEACSAPMAAINLVEKDVVRCWAGWRVPELTQPRHGSFCQLVLDADDAVIVPDVREDPRLRDHPLVVGGPQVRFFAAAPLHSDGQTIGTLCVYDVEPRPAADGLLHTLCTLASWVDAEATARHRLERAARIGDDVIATISHEVRTPVSSIQGYLELIADELPDEHGPFVRAIERNVAKLCRTVDQLVLTACGNSGGLARRWAPVDLTELVGEFVGPGVAISVSGPVYAVADATLLARAVQSVLANALLFSEPGSPVEVSVTAGPSPAITVVDHGWGIPDSELDLVRQPFYRGARAQAQHVPGVGLGLTTAGQILAAHGGELTIGATEGGGVTVTLILRGAGVA